MEITPKKLTDLEVALSNDVSELMPKYEDVPDKFKTHSHYGYVGLVNDWFYAGVTPSKLSAKEGIDRKDALRHMSAILRSWQPKHEHKIAAVAYLMSLWFDIVDEKAKA